jgi:hypothetical protein
MVTAVSEWRGTTSANPLVATLVPFLLLFKPLFKFFDELF